MLVNVRLVVLSVGVLASHLMVDQVHGAPRAPAPGSEAVYAPPAIVTDTAGDQSAAPQVVNVRVYRAAGVAVDALRAALTVAEATFAAASVGVAWKVCGPADCNTPLSPAERVVRMVRSPKGGKGDTRALGAALIDSERGTGVLATNTHGTSGLMREVWSLEELVASRVDDWILRPVEAAAIRQRLISAVAL